jgi:hypothetical protein
MVLLDFSEDVAILDSKIEGQIFAFYCFLHK